MFFFILNLHSLISLILVMRASPGMDGCSNFGFLAGGNGRNDWKIEPLGRARAGGNEPQA
jgi:hypothetical protein